MSQEAPPVRKNARGSITLMPQENKWSGFLSSFELFSDDFLSNGREQSVVQERENLLKVVDEK